MPADTKCFGCGKTFLTVLGVLLCPDCTEQHLEYWASMLIKGYDRKALNDWEPVGRAFRNLWGGTIEEWGLPWTYG